MKNKTDIILNSAEELMCGMTDPVQDTITLKARKK